MWVIHCPVRMYCVYTAELHQLEAVWTSLGRPLQTCLLPAVCVLYKCGFNVMHAAQRQNKITAAGM